jgi:hypothetical protein
MSRKVGDIFPPELREKHFPELPETQVPTKLQFKERILQLHEADETAEAAVLLEWNEKLNTKEPESRLSKASKVTMFVLGVVAVTLGVLWFLFGGVGGKGDSLIVCSVGGEIIQGDQCLSDNPTGVKETPKDDDDSSKSDDKSDQIFVGS